MVGETQARELIGDLFDVDGRPQLAVAALEALTFVSDQHSLELRVQALEAGFEAGYRGAERIVRLQAADRPSARSARGALQRQQRCQLRRRALATGAGARPVSLP